VQTTCGGSIRKPFLPLGAPLFTVRRADQSARRPNISFGELGLNGLKARRWDRITAWRFD
jgi:hypothetical protein